MNYSTRAKVYTNAYIHFGERNQMVVAIEELSECQKEICKALRGNINEDHFAEEIADALIMLEQMQMYFGLQEKVNHHMDNKIVRLDRKLRGCPFGETVGE